MSRNQFTLLLITTITFLNIISSNSAAATALLANTYYDVRSKNPNKCLNFKFAKSIIIYSDCPTDTKTITTKNQFLLKPSGTDYQIWTREANTNVLDLTTGSAKVVNWPQQATPVKPEQTWTITWVVTDGNGVDWWTIKNKSTGNCLKYDAAVTDTGSVVATQVACPADPSTDDTVLFSFNRIKARVSGYLKYAGTTTSIPAVIMNTAGSKITFMDGATNFGDATLDLNAATYTIDVIIDVTYTVKITIDDLYFAATAPATDFTLNAPGIAFDALNNASVTASNIPLTAYQYTWKLQLSWKAVVSDLDIYIKSANGLNFYKKPTGNNVSYPADQDMKSFDTTLTRFEEIDLLPTTTGDYTVYVKNYSKEGKLKDTGAQIRLIRRKTDGTSNPATPEVITIKTDDHDVRNYYWKAFTIKAMNQKYTTHNLVCVDPLDTSCNA
jgi:hypothetical protein